MRQLRALRRLRGPRPLYALTALAAAVGALAIWAAPQATGEPGQAVTALDASLPGGAAAPSAAEGQGRALFADGCSSCHGMDATGVAGRGPSLVGAGAASLDFYLSTGRMPLASPGIQPERADPIYSPNEIDALIAYVTSPGVGGTGPSIPAVDPARGDVADGRALFADSCSGCHQIQAEGGIAPGLVAPPLEKATPTQIGEAIRVGPYLMPKFGEGQLSSQDVDSLAAFITGPGTEPVNRGGWGIGNIGPVTEGLVAFLLIGTLLVLTARVIGERTG